MDPTVETPPMPTSAQVTSLFDAPRTTAENCVVLPAGTEIFSGLTETAVSAVFVGMGSGVEIAGLVLPRLQPELTMSRLEKQKRETPNKHGFLDHRGSIGHLTV